MNSNGNCEILGYKKDILNQMKKLKINYLKEQELEVIVYKNLAEEAKKNPLSSDIKIRKIMENQSTITVISKISWEDRESRKVNIAGAASNLEFIISKWLMEKIDHLIIVNKGLGRITVRKHDENIYFIEKFESLLSSKEENFRTVCELRKNYSTDEWKNILLGSVGYDLRDSKNLTKDLLLIRLMPYLEKNYNYIELGGKATGKTTIAEKFNTGEKISANISKSQLIYNVQKKKDGILFNKDVLYLDETNFTSMNKEVAPALLQAKAGNEVEVRGDYDARRTHVSFVSQGNIENAEFQFKNRTLLKDFDKGFNNDAHFDRECFLIAGWLIPSYSRMNLRDDTLGMRLDIFEDYLNVLREKESYDKNIENLNINLVGSTATGRFNEQIRKTVSGLLKLLYPDERIDFEADKAKIDAIVFLSCLGKYLIQECAYDLGKSEYKNDYLEFSYTNYSKMKITRIELENLYVKNKEIAYFKEDIIKEETAFMEIPWEINLGRKIAVKGNLEYLKLRVNIPEDIQLIFNEIPETNKKEKEILEDSYKIVEAYKESTKADDDVREYMRAYLILSNYIKFISKLKKKLDELSLVEINPLVIFLLDNLPEKEEYQYHPTHHYILSSFQKMPESDMLQEISSEIRKIQHKLNDKILNYQKGLSGKIVFDDPRFELQEAMYKLENITNNESVLGVNDKNIKSKIIVKLKEDKNLMNYKISGSLEVTTKDMNSGNIQMSEITSDNYENIGKTEFLEGIGGVTEMSIPQKVSFDSDDYIESISLKEPEKLYEIFTSVVIRISIVDINTKENLRTSRVELYDKRSQLEKSLGIYRPV